jgi:asparagine synthase (glutamine-hydrolysing)
MLDKIQHRGPDDEGLYINDEQKVMFGHRRLSIIDLSKAGHQPMSFENGRYWICYNGEVYNYEHIRKELQLLGKSFVSHSDTEVILAAYAQWGAQLLHKLRGMFAFAIWDSLKKNLFIARDRIGIKPLYYSKFNDVFVFASEVKAIVASSIPSRRTSPEAVADFLQYGSVSQPRTIYADIHALLPGHYLTIGEGELTICKYWDLYDSTLELQNEYKKISFQESVSLLRKNLEDATVHHLVADVPVGAFLSGGIDSSAVVGLMTRITSEPIKTYSVGFSQYGERRNELTWAKRVSEYYHTNHSEILVSPADGARHFHSMMNYIDQPSADGLNTFIVSLFARQGVKVALSGLGGDELFGGYPHFSRITNSARIFPKGNRFLHSLLHSTQNLLPFRIYPFLNTLSSSEQERILALRRLHSLQTENIISPQLLVQLNFEQNNTSRFEIFRLEKNDVFRAISFFEFSTYLRDTLLRDADQMSMAHALELRPILLDHILVEHAFALPSNLKEANGNPKRLFVEAIKDILPPFVAKRKKMGFEMPLVDWLNEDLNDYARSVFSSATADAIFHPQYLHTTRTLLKEKKLRSFRDWAYFVLLAFFDTNPAELPTSVYRNNAMSSVL